MKIISIIRPSGNSRDRAFMVQKVFNADEKWDCKYCKISRGKVMWLHWNFSFLFPLCNNNYTYVLNVPLSFVFQISCLFSGSPIELIFQSSQKWFRKITGFHQGQLILLLLGIHSWTTLFSLQSFHYLHLCKMQWRLFLKEADY